MPINLQSWSIAIQTVLMAVIAVTNGFWAYKTYTEDRKRAVEQQAHHRRVAQNEAISHMSRQLGLMEAQCEETPLSTILDERSPARPKEQCYEAYIAARSLFFHSKVRIARDPKLVSEKDWEDLWHALHKSLSDAGDIGYDSKRLSTDWKAIVEKTKRY